eukprot:gene6013-6251_t
MKQRQDECTYSSFISYHGSPGLEQKVVAAANNQQLCDLLSTYCDQAFAPKHDGSTAVATHHSLGGPQTAYVLTATSGDADPELPPVLQYNCKRHAFDQQLDHFNHKSQQTFKQVYWTCDSAWPHSKRLQAEAGHVIVFLGNESPLGAPRQPIVFENAARLHALVLLVEHRYYGDSQPFPVKSGKLPTDQYTWLTIQQVIEDTATVLAHVRAELDVPGPVPAVVIGGSYGGMLAAYHRVVKPDVFAAAVAASAPIQYVLGTGMWRATSDRYHQFIAASLAAWGGQACQDTIRRGIAQIASLSANDAGRKKVAETFQLCGTDPLPDADAAFALQMDQREPIARSAQGMKFSVKQSKEIVEMYLANKFRR